MRRHSGRSVHGALRNALIVKEHATLLYPEGTACADVLLAGEEGGANASTVFSGMGLAAIFKFIVDGLKMIPADIAVAFSSFKGALGMEVYPALLGVGYIVGPKTASYMFTGSLVGWMVIIPLICLFGANISCTRQQPAPPLLICMQQAVQTLSGPTTSSISAQVPLLPAVSSR